MAIRPRRIGHVGLVARDVDALVGFYEDVLGLRVSDRMPYPEDSPFTEGAFLRCNSDHHVVSIFGLRGEPPPRPAKPRAPRPGVHHVAFELETLGELRRAAREVRERGLALHAMRMGGPGCQLRLYLWDPEDNLVELYWGLDQIGWDGRARPFPPITEVDLETMDLEAWLEEKGPEFRAR